MSIINITGLHRREKDNRLHRRLSPPQVHRLKSYFWQEFTYPDDRYKEARVNVLCIRFGRRHREFRAVDPEQQYIVDGYFRDLDRMFPPRQRERHRGRLDKNGKLALTPGKLQPGYKDKRRDKQK